MSLTFNANNGTVWPFDGSVGVITIDEDEGIFTIPTDLTVDQRVNSDGAVLLNTRRSPRRVVLNFLLAVEAPDSLLQLWASFFAALASGGSLVYDGPNGGRTLREIVLEGPDRSMTGQDIQFRNEDAFQVSLIALDPWWYGAAVTEDITIGAATAWNAAIPWNSAIPWDGGASFAVSVLGDTPAWPRWTLHGEFSTLTVQPADADAGSWTWDSTLSSTSYGTVDHRPGSRSPRLGSELNGIAESAFGLWGLVDDSSALDWGLEPGLTSVVVGATGTGGSTTLALWYEPRYLTP